MSTFSPAKLRCSCTFVFDIDVADSLHISLRPDLREAIFDGTFHVFRCPLCQAPNVLEKLLAYTDFSRRHWFTVVPVAELPLRDEWLRFANQSFVATMVDRAAPMARAWAPEFVQRVIFGFASLREKLVIFDAGLDDRIIEAWKLQLLREGELGFSASTYFHLVEAADDLVFEYGDKATGTSRIALPRLHYDVAVQTAPEFEAAVPELWADIAVDYRMVFTGRAQLETVSDGVA